MKHTDTNNFLHQVLNIDLNDYLKALGMEPLRTHNDITYYRSPFYSEHPLEVHNKFNKWYDRNTGPRMKEFIEFGTMYHKCSITEFFKLLHKHYPYAEQNTTHPHMMVEENNREEHLHPLVVNTGLKLSEENYKHIAETFYVQEEIADKYFSGVELTRFPGVSTGVAFKNDRDGLYVSYANRRSFTYGEFSTTTIDNGSSRVDVFRSIADLVALQALRGFHETHPNNILVLNKLFLFEEARPYLESHQQVNLYLDHSLYSYEVVGYAQWLDDTKYKDFSMPYKKDFSLNTLLLNKECFLAEIQKKISQKRGL